MLLQLVLGAQLFTLAVTAALDRPQLGHGELLRRQTLIPGAKMNDFYKHGCRALILVYAKGSLQGGNMGQTPGPQFAAALRHNLGEHVAIQGFKYRADIIDNFKAGEADEKKASGLADLIKNVTAKCPKSKLTVSGYSLGASMVHVAVQHLDNQAKDRISAIVNFGDPRQQDDHDQIPNFDKTKTLLICNKSDHVCKDNNYFITLDHMVYEKKVKQAVDFILDKTGMKPHGQSNRVKN